MQRDACYPTSHHLALGIRYGVNVAIQVINGGDDALDEVSLIRIFELIKTPECGAVMRRSRVLAQLTCTHICHNRCTLSPHIR